MFDNKYLVNLYVLFLDKHFEIFIPVDEKIGNITKLIKSAIVVYGCDDSDGILFNLNSGLIYNKNDIVRNTDIKYGTKLILI